MYIVCEGVVGTGKTTQSKNIVHRLQQEYPHQEVLWIREPGGTEIAEAIRTLVQGTSFTEEIQPLTDVYLYAAARAQLLGAVVKPALERGAWVISDRNVCSSLAYQGRSQGVGLERVWEVNAAAVEEVLPTQILFFDLPVEIGMQRTFDALGDKRELQGKEFFDRAYAWYQQIPEQTPLADVYHAVDVSWTQQAVLEKLQEIITPLLPQKE